jgi:hypothetical protein
MIGQLVPVVLLPRFTSFVGSGSFTTVPMNVEEYETGTVIFWRGKLVGGAASNPFTAYIEESHDAQLWVPLGPGAITTSDRSDDYLILLKRRWLRVRVELAADTNSLAGISLWMAGSLVGRVIQG